MDFFDKKNIAISLPKPAFLSVPFLFLRYGHSIKNCPELKASSEAPGLQSASMSAAAKKGAKKRSAQQAGIDGHRDNIVCFKCLTVGHHADMCPKKDYQPSVVDYSVWPLEVLCLPFYLF